MSKLNAWLIIIAGVALLFPLIGITQLGTPTDGALAWILAIVVLLIGILKVTKKYNK